MHALITGGAGFIGSHLAEALLARGQRVTAVDNLSTGRHQNIESLAANPQFQFVYETVTNETVMDRLVSECDVIFHLAAAVGVELIVKDPVKTIETNLEGTEVVLKLGRRYRKKVLIASTSEVYGKSAEATFREDADVVLGPTTRGRWSYAASKMVDEFLALAYYKERKLPTVVVRLFNTVGPRQTGRYGMVIPTFVRQALEGTPITVYGDGAQSRCFCHIADVCRALVGLAEHPAAVGQVFNVGSSEEITIRSLAERVKELSGSPSPIRTVPYDEAYEEGFEDMRRRVPDLSKIGALLGWRPTHDLDAILRSVIEYERARRTA